MDDRFTERLVGSCMIIGESLQGAAEALRAVAAAFEAAQVAKALNVDLGNVWKDGEQDAMNALRRIMNEIGGDIDKEMLQELAEMVEDMPPIIHKKMPRPPKCLGPVNKVNYSANRPPRRARSSCRIMNRR